MSINLKLNKTKMYQLVSIYFKELEYGGKMPKMIDCYYKKAYRSCYSWLDFHVSDYSFRTYIGVCFGRPYLRIRVFDLELCLMDKVFHPSFDELNHMDMLDEVV